MSMNELLARFHDVAANPSAQMKKYLAEGKKVVLTAPVYTPEEIIHSMGLVPMGAWGGDLVLDRAKEYFPAFICSIMQSILELGMKGTYDGASAIVIPSLCDSLKCLGQNWKYAVPGIPFIPMTYPQNRNNEVGKTFVKAGYRRVAADLEKATGAVFSEEALAESIKVYNKHNAVMRKLDEALASHPEVTNAQRSDVYKSAFFMTKEEHTVLAEKLLSALNETPASGKVKIVTSGILCDAPSLLESFDALGFQIVADDVAAESRQYRTDAPEKPEALDALAEKFAAMDNCSVLFDVEKKRAGLIVKTAQERGAKAVVLVLTKFCDPEEFDAVPVRRACEAADLPFVLIEVDRQMADLGQARTILETLRDSLNA